MVLPLRAAISSTNKIKNRKMNFGGKSWPSRSATRSPQKNVPLASAGTDSTSWRRVKHLAFFRIARRGRPRRLHSRLAECSAGLPVSWNEYKVCWFRPPAWVEPVLTWRPRGGSGGHFTPARAPRSIPSACPLAGSTSRQASEALVRPAPALPLSAVRPSMPAHPHYVRPGCPCQLSVHA